MQWLCRQGLPAEIAQLSAATSNIGDSDYANYTFSVHQRITSCCYLLTARIGPDDPSIVLYADLPAIWIVQNEFSLRSIMSGLRPFTAADLRAMRISLRADAGP